MPLPPDPHAVGFLYRASLTPQPPPRDPQRPVQLLGYPLDAQLNDYDARTLPYLWRVQVRSPERMITYDNRPELYELLDVDAQGQRQWSAQALTLLEAHYSWFCFHDGTHPCEYWISCQGQYLLSSQPATTPLGDQELELAMQDAGDIYTLSHWYGVGVDIALRRLRQYNLTHKDRPLSPGAAHMRHIDAVVDSGRTNVRYFTEQLGVRAQKLVDWL